MMSEGYLNIMKYHMVFCVFFLYNVKYIYSGVKRSMKSMMEYLRKILFTVLGVVIIYTSVSFAMKAGIGLVPVDALVATIADVIHMKVGTFTILFHGSFIVGQILIQKKNFPKTEFLQIPYLLFSGSILNFIYYVVVKDVVITAYAARLSVTVIAFIFTTLGCTLILRTKLMSTPMEGFIQLIADKIGTTMGKLRLKIDIALVLICVLLTLIFGTEWTVREGTIIGALIFGPFMDLWNEILSKKKK